MGTGKIEAYSLWPVNLITQLTYYGKKFIWCING